MALRVLITGGSSGIGRGITAEFVAADPASRIVLIARDEGRLGEVASKLGRNVTWYAADVGHAGQVRQAVESAVADLGGDRRRSPSCRLRVPLHHRDSV